MPWFTPEAEVSTSGATTLVEALDQAAAGPDCGFRFIASDLGETAVSYSTLRTLAAGRAAQLSALGLAKGDRAALVVSDDLQFVVTFVACAVAGIVPVPVSPFVTARSLDGFRDTVAGIVRKSGARVVLTTRSMRANLEPLLHRGLGLECIAAVETDLPATPPALEPPRARPEDLCFLQFTSGSVAFPRGVMVTHANLMANVSSIAGPEGFGPARSEPYPDLVVSWLPLFHDMGLIGCVLTSLASGVPAVIISTTAFARDPRIWLRTIHRFRGTITYAPNFAYELAARRLRDRDLETLDLTSLRVAGCGGEPIRAATLASFAARLAAAGFRSEALVPSYGLAEATLAVTLRRAGVPLRVDRVDAGALGRGCATPAGEGADRVLELVSCGVPFSGQHVAVLDGDDRALPERRVGEITVTGPAVAAGYYRDPETTARTFRNGRLYTGDLGYLAGGELYVCGRLKDVIIIRGHNFYPQDIEWSVRDLPGIRQGSVVAFGVAEAGEERLVVAAETDHAEGGPLRESIAARIYESLGLEVGTIVLVAPGALPKTTSGKLMRTRAKQLFERGLLVDGCS